MSWIPVEERLPEASGGTLVLVTNKQGRVHAASVTGQGDFFYIMTGGVMKDVVAWMPYPKPYQKPRRFVVIPYSADSDMCRVQDKRCPDIYAPYIPTREAAQRIADIYEEAYR